MERVLPLYQMVPDAQLGWMVLTKGPLHDTKITQRIKDMTEAVPCPRDVAALDDLNFIFLIPEHSAMCPDTGFVEFVSPVWFPPPPFPPY